MTESHTTIKIANMSLQVPIYQDTQTTQKIAKQISTVLADIEKKSPRIDTQAFALQAAFEYATLLHQSKIEAESDTKELLMALDEVVSRLRNLLDPDDQ
jgi:cell division protein ZapA (FtsZ GTPase activity inhibitor)